METRERLAELLKGKRWSQSDLAAELGERRGWVNDRVTGRIAIKADELPRIANALGVDCSEFFVESACPEARRPATLRPSSREQRLVDAFMADLSTLTPDDLQGARRVLSAIELMIQGPPDPPQDEPRESAG